MEDKNKTGGAFSAAVGLGVVPGWDDRVGKQPDPSRSGYPSAKKNLGPVVPFGISSGKGECWSISAITSYCKQLMEELFA